MCNVQDVQCIHSQDLCNRELCALWFSNTLWATLVQQSTLDTAHIAWMACYTNRNIRTTNITIIIHIPLTFCIISYLRVSLIYPRKESKANGFRLINPNSNLSVKIANFFVWGCECWSSQSISKNRFNSIPTYNNDDWSSSDRISANR